MSSRWTKTAINLALAGALVVTAACSSGLVKSLSALNALHQQLKEKYQEDIGVNLQNSNVLFISFINSPLNQQDSIARAQRAAETAKFAASKAHGIKTINQIWVGFVASETRYLVVHYTRNIDAFGFDRNGTPISIEPPTFSEDPRAAIAKYNQGSNETDISITRIQLEGDMNNGIALVPHFTVKGDIQRSKTPARAPEIVALDFASYADKPAFAENAKLEIHCDDRLAFSGSARLLSGKTSSKDASVAQFLTAEIPFKLFKRMVDARNVTLRLGPKRFELSQDDIGALGTMSLYVSSDEANRQG